MDKIKIIKQDGINRVFILSNGDSVPFDDFKQYKAKVKPNKKKKSKKIEKKLDLDNPIELADFKHGELAAIKNTNESRVEYTEDNLYGSDDID